jgi:DNA-binding sugar fermentation-stimulating protein
MDAKKEGYIPFMLYVCQLKRDKFRIANEIDPEYNKALNEAVEEGLSIITVHTVFDEEKGIVTLDKGGQFEVTDI